MAQIGTLFGDSLRGLTSFALLIALLAATTVRADHAYKVPFQIIDSQIHVYALVNKKPAHVVIDTGAAVSAFSLSFMPPIPLGHSTIVTPSGNREVLVNDVECSLDGSRFIVRAAFIDGWHPDGLIGFDILKSYRSVTFDFDRHEIVLVR